MAQEKGTLFHLSILSFTPFGPYFYALSETKAQKASFKVSLVALPSSALFKFDALTPKFVCVRSEAHVCVCVCMYVYVSLVGLYKHTDTTLLLLLPYTPC